MVFRDLVSNYLYKQAEKRGWLDDYKRSIRYGGVYPKDEGILESSDVYELLQDISNQMMLADIVIEDSDENEIKNHPTLKIVKKPNNYLTPLWDSSQLYLLSYSLVVKIQVIQNYTNKISMMRNQMFIG